MSKFKAVIIESERGCGAKIDEVKEFDTMEDRDSWVESYNRKYNPGTPSKVAPGWYTVAHKA